MSDAKKECSTCHGAGVVTCPNCSGKKELECSNCHGKGHFDTCSHCRSTGKETCSDCGGTGKVGVDCPVCHHGYIQRTRMVNCSRCLGKGAIYYDNNGNLTDERGAARSHGRRRICPTCEGRGQVEESYDDICPKCNGDYKGSKGEKTCGSCGGTGERICSSCDGSGKMKCRVCGGSGKNDCHKCSGTGSVKCPECKKREKAERQRIAKEQEAEKRRKEKAAAAERERTRPSYQNRARFMMLGVVFGLSGVHYAYIRRWFLFLIQLALTGFGVAQCMIPSLGQPVTNFLLPHIEKLEEAGLYCLGDALRHPVLLLALAWSLLGAILVRKDGTNHKMRYDPEKWGFVFLALVQLGLMLCAFGKTGFDAESIRRSILVRIGIASWTIPFLYAKQWKYFLISFLPVLVDVAFFIGIGPFKLWNIVLGWYFLWHIWAVIRTTKEL